MPTTLRFEKVPVTEYPFTGHERYDAGAGVAYAYNNNDGLLTLADADGFDMAVLRGGAHTRLYAGATSLTEPEERPPAHVFGGGQAVELARFQTRVETNRVSFFGPRDGFVADVGFYRTEGDHVEDRDYDVWVPAEHTTQLEPSTEAFAPQSLYLAMQEQDGGSSYHSLTRGGTGSALQVDAGQPLHLIAPPTTDQQGLDAIGLDLTVSGTDDFCCTVAIKDPLNPRLDLIHVPIAGRGGERYRLHFDPPGQVLLPGSRLWITLVFDRPATLSGPAGGAPQVLLSYAPERTVLASAFAHRMFLLRSYFCICSEARQWGGYRLQDH